MRKLFIGFALAASCLGAYAACTVRVFSTNPQVITLIKEKGWDFKDYDAICRKLEKANAGLHITAQGTVLNGVSIGWASVSLQDRDLQIGSSQGHGLSTQTNPFASMDKAVELQFHAINRAIEAVDIDKGLNSLNEARQKIKTSTLK
ncbi:MULTISPECIES: hypothetical protein [unclassified Polaromonas]|jgi:hypothetical protein|uniref:hypothetical protein n=1 Tax=unclassified Polaromonas TaxID=2638319 RepID=UPI000BC9911C|nr:MULTISPECIES: hypothetical protein [unclassified Polaromonas]OYZ77066.1 MAG: hypothetical protein B7Y09_18325 [Polaromonas sp. 24-63-21]OZA86357.1 MAG: hypothetical protein B7X65_17865 [Polaromonas sp. 39-63-25]